MFLFFLSPSAICGGECTLGSPWFEAWPWWGSVKGNSQEPKKPKTNTTNKKKKTILLINTTEKLQPTTSPNHDWNTSPWTNHLAPTELPHHHWITSAPLNHLNIHLHNTQYLNLHNAIEPPHHHQAISPPWNLCIAIQFFLWIHSISFCETSFFFLCFCLYVFTVYCSVASKVSNLVSQSLL